MVNGAGFGLEGRTLQPAWLAVASHPAARGGRTNTMPSGGAGCTLWTALDGQYVQAVEQPRRRPETAAVADDSIARVVRRKSGAA